MVQLLEHLQDFKCESHLKGHKLVVGLGGPSIHFHRVLESDDQKFDTFVFYYRGDAGAESCSRTTHSAQLGKTLNCYYRDTTNSSLINWSAIPTTPHLTFLFEGMLKSNASYYSSPKQLKIFE